MAQRLGNVAVGSIVKMKESGTAKNYIVVQQGLPGAMYDASCNGTWLRRELIYGESIWDADETTNYAESDVNKWLNSVVLNKFEQAIKPYIKDVKIPYMTAWYGNPQTGANGLSAKLFLLSPKELGFMDDDAYNYGGFVPNDGAKLSYYLYSNQSGANAKRVAKYNGVAKGYATRTPAYSTDKHIACSYQGKFGDSLSKNESYILYAFVMNPNVLVDDNGNVLAETYPDPPTIITVPDSAISGTDISITWSTVSGATYQLERSADDGAWTKIYTGTDTSYQEKVGKWNTVKYRIACVKSGVVSGYTTSKAVPVTQYMADTFSVPEQAMEGQPIPILWSSNSQADTFVLERNLNGGGSWTRLYSGQNKSFNDTAGSWTSVQYRVKAGKDGVFGEYVTSAVIPVVPASALVISGTDGDLGKLTKDVRYTVTSNTVQPITLERRVNGLQIASLTVQSGFVYNIPVMELPTGTGTIKITAKVTPSGSGEVTVVRSWTYTKDAQTFPGDGGGGVVKNDDKTVLPLTIAECVRVPKNWGGSLDKALEKLQYSVDPLRIITGTYAGTGTFGQSTPNTIPVPFKPYLAFIGDTADNTVATVCMIRGRLSVVTRLSNPLRVITPTWSDTALSWYGATAEGQMNVTGRNYTYVIIGQ